MPNLQEPENYFNNAIKAAQNFIFGMAHRVLEWRKEWVKELLARKSAKLAMTGAALGNKASLSNPLQSLNPEAAWNNSIHQQLKKNQGLSAKQPNVPQPKSSGPRPS